jgi:hypothetical protein
MDKPWVFSKSWLMGFFRTLTCLGFSNQIWDSRAKWMDNRGPWRNLYYSWLVLLLLLLFFKYAYIILYLFSVALQSLKDLGSFTYRRFLELFRHMVGLLGRVISPSQGLYPHRTTQHEKTRTCLERDSNPLSQQPTGQDPRLRSHGHCDRHIVHLVELNNFILQLIIVFFLFIFKVD